MYKIYGHSECKYCHLAKEHLDNLSIPYTYHNIRKDPYAMKFVKETLSQRTVPQILHEDEYIGGYEALLAHLDEDELFD